VRPVLEFMRALPAPVILPMALLLLGANTGMKVAVIAFGSSWPVMLNSIDGARSVDPLLIDTGKVNRLGTFAILRRIVLPASLPQISAGMRTALGIALILMVFSEMIGSDSGLGFQILTSQRRFLVPETYGGVLLIGLIGWAFTVVFAFTERRVLAWHHGRTGGGAGG
jgi:ABC-type nitrate/sulfonate/bicarbonate transport system permease component